MRGVPLHASVQDWQEIRHWLLNGVTAEYGRFRNDLSNIPVQGSFYPRMTPLLHYFLGYRSFLHTNPCSSSLGDVLVVEDLPDMLTILGSSSLSGPFTISMSCFQRLAPAVPSISLQNLI